MSLTDITVYSTFIEVPSDEYGYFTNSFVNIKSIAGKFIEFEFRPGQRPYPKQRFTLFDQKRNVRIMPRYALPLLTQYLDNNRVKYNIVQGELITQQQQKTSITTNQPDK